MYRMTIKGKPVGDPYKTEKEVIQAVIRNWGVFHYLDWKRVDAQ